MSDLIDRNDALKAISYEIKYGTVIDHCGLDVAYDIIEELPSVEQTAKVENIRVDYDSGGICFKTYGDCGNCGEEVNSDDRYCHYCGMKLDWRKNNENVR